MHFSRKILVALDSSDAAEKALKRAVLIAERMQATLKYCGFGLYSPITR